MRILNYLDFLRMFALEPITLSAMTFLSGCISEWRVQVQLIRADKIRPVAHSMETRAQFLRSLAVLGEAASQMNMEGAAIGIKRAREECLEHLAAPIGTDAHRLQQIVSHAERVVTTFMDELSGRYLLVLASKHAEFFQLPDPFGDSVAAAFPSATYDISEAAKCRALGRWTATVMHLMRVLEVGLRALAEKYGLEAGPNWNTLLNQIEAESRKIGKRTHGAAEEQWAAEAATHLRFIKNAWRNHAMHALEKYDEERSVAIFENTRDFMKHLSINLSEKWRGCDNI
jgi:hypothetical protein